MTSGSSSYLEIARDLRAAGDYLRAHGWGGFGAPEIGIGKNGGPRCMAGAIYSAVGIDFYADYDCMIGEHLAALGFNSDAVWASNQSGYVAGWNDAYGRTVKEVLDRLESTALALEIRALAAASVSGNPDVPLVAELANSPAEVPA